MSNYKILVVDDDPLNLTSSKVLLEKHGYKVVLANGGKEAITLFNNRRSEFALILMDYLMPDLNGVETVEEILKVSPHQLIAIYSCDDSKGTLKSTIRSGAVDFIEKDLDPEDLLLKVASLCEKFEQTTKPIDLPEEQSEPEKLIASTGLIGKSEALAQVVKLVKRFANSQQTALILGETGTGKEVIAQALHRLGDRASQRFVALNCAAIPKELLESTLFGHEKGAFTGAVNKRRGKFAEAHRGTLFLDEIGDLSLDLQAKILRVLQERVIEPVGSSESTKVDVRIIAATHKNLETLVKDGLFREDLYYRLNELTIQIPALRDRPDDIEPLIAHFTEEYCARTKEKKRFERGTLPVLTSYRWPGNVRELKSAVEKHLLSVASSTVKVEDLDSKLFEKVEIDTKSIKILDLERKQKAEMRRLLSSVLKKSKSNSDAARQLGISPSRLHYYLGSYKLPR